MSLCICFTETYHRVYTLQFIGFYALYPRPSVNRIGRMSICMLDWSVFTEYCVERWPSTWPKTSRTFNEFARSTWFKIRRNYWVKFGCKSIVVFINVLSRLIEFDIFSVWSQRVQSRDAQVSLSLTPLPYSTIKPWTRNQKPAKRIRLFQRVFPYHGLRFLPFLCHCFWLYSGLFQYRLTAWQRRWSLQVLRRWIFLQCSPFTACH